MTDPDHARLRRPLALAALFAVAFVYATTPVLTVLYPGFSWTEQPLSALGVPSAPTAAAFNGTMIAFGVVAVAFVLIVALDSGPTVSGLGAGVVALGYAAAALVGVFPHPHPTHDEVAVLSYALGATGLFVYGAGTALAGDRRTGAVTVGLGALSLAVWAAWIVFVGTGPEIALPEYASALALDLWLVLIAVEYLRGGRSAGDRE